MGKGVVVQTMDNGHCVVGLTVDIESCATRICLEGVQRQHLTFQPSCMSYWLVPKERVIGRLVMRGVFRPSLTILLLFHLTFLRSLELMSPICQSESNQQLFPCTEYA